MLDWNLRLEPRRADWAAQVQVASDLPPGTFQLEGPRALSALSLSINGPPPDADSAAGVRVGGIAESVCQLSTVMLSQSILMCALLRQLPPGNLVLAEISQQCHCTGSTQAPY